MSEQLIEPLLISTGSVENPTPVSRAILEGYAEGNELYTYAEYPTVTHAELADLQDKTFAEVFYMVTKKLVGDAIPDDVLKSISEDAYSAENFDFDSDRSLRFTTLSSGLHVVGLSDGPTASFKDMAMQPMARMMSYLQGETGRRLTILLSTSGDTGPAALHAFGGLPDTEIIGMLPHSGVSRFQWSQMAELGRRQDVHVLEVAGNFSDLNDYQMEADLLYDLGAANSVNIARIISQVAYHVASYVKAVKLEGKNIGDPVDISIPSGNFGNALSAIVARRMGVPYRNIIVATNENNVLDTLFRERIFKRSEFQHTDSSAQDIRMPSNIWRYFGMLYDNDPAKISKLYQMYERTGAVALKDVGDINESYMNGIVSVTVRGDDRARMMRKVFDESDSRRIIVDPHTANGLAAVDMLQAQEPGVPMLTLETAKPFKFDEIVSKVLHTVSPRPSRFLGLEQSQAEAELTQIEDFTGLLHYLDTFTRAKRK